MKLRYERRLPGSPRSDPKQTGLQQWAPASGNNAQSG